MKIVLVIHKYGVALDDPCYFPTGPAMVSAVLKRNGHDVKVLNENLWDHDLRQELKGADVCMMGGFEEFKPYIIRDAAICKEMGIKVITGGALSTFLPDEMLVHADVVVLGEAEDVLDRVLDSTGKVMGSKPDLDTLPLPDLQSFGIDEYNRRHDFVYLNVLTSRGCNQMCRFCSQTCYFQFRSLPKVWEEIDYYRAKYNPETIVFSDNTFNIRRDRFMAICDGMKERKLKWGAAIRVDRWDDEMAKKAADSGAGHFVVGIESFNQDKLDRISKRTTVEQNFRCLDSLHKHGISYHGNVLVGFPWETFEDIMDEVNVIPDGYNVFPCMVQPFVGTQYKGRSISREEYAFLDDSFRRYAESHELRCYPEVEDAA